MIGRVATAMLLATLAACTSTPPPAPCPPPPPSLVCAYGPEVLAWGTGWLARHLIDAPDEAVIAALKADVAAKCPSASAAPLPRTQGSGDFQLDEMRR